jgi:hypothetical protein
MLFKAVSFSLLLITSALTGADELQERDISELWYSFAVSTNAKSYKAVSFSRSEAENEALVGCLEQEKKYPCKVDSWQGPKAFMAYICNHLGHYYIVFFSGIGDLDETTRHTAGLKYGLYDNKCELAALWDPLSTKVISWIRQ